VGAAGTVTLRISGNTLLLVSVATNPGWSVTETEAEPTSVHVHFKNGGSEVEFQATLSGGEIVVKGGGSVSAGEDQPGGHESGGGADD
jgi:hypothetical protein